MLVPIFLALHVMLMARMTILMKNVKNVKVKDLSTTTSTSLISKTTCSHVFLCSCDVKLIPVSKDKEN